MKIIILVLWFKLWLEFSYWFTITSSILRNTSTCNSIFTQSIWTMIQIIFFIKIIFLTRWRIWFEIMIIIWLLYKRFYIITNKLYLFNLCSSWIFNFLFIFNTYFIRFFYNRFRLESIINITFSSFFSIVRLFISFFINFFPTKFSFFW